jgi:uncharacterized protein YbjT (DUF2867 family)
MAKVFITGGTGYIGQRLIPVLLSAGHQVAALTRASSAHKLPQGCLPVVGDALDGRSYVRNLNSYDTFVQLVGVAHPSPAKAKEFVAIDQKSGMEAIQAAKNSGIAHFVYVSVAHPAPAMHAYIAARTACETELQASGLNATILRPWYVLGPGHRWPYALIPLYWIAERIPSKRESALRLGLVTVAQMVRALADAVQHPVHGVKIVEVPAIRAAG